jgi:RNA polymerase sigma-70 factor (ECF subfamily)
VKSALNRGRSKLASLPPRQAPAPAENLEASRLLQLYVERFNQRDWDGIRELITADARLVVADRFEGRLADAPYFARYEAMATPWRMAAGVMHDTPVIMVLRQHNGQWAPQGIIRVEVTNNSITRVVDYSHCPWVLATAEATVVQMS